jgi:serine/threonine protein kinase
MPPTGDPERIGPYRILEPLSAGCCSVTTYLGRAPSGERVVVRHYAEPDLRRPADPSVLERLRDPAAVGTVHVVDIGPDYLVTEYVDGPSLTERIQTRRAVSGVALQRLAIATVTAVAALHRAGVHPVGLRPDSILLGPDGPRLVYLGPEQHDPLGPSHDTKPVEPGSLAWRAPEELQGDRPGAAADLFAWAAVMAYAATGRDPFDGGSVAATAKRLLNAAANLGALEDGPLRDLLADCLVAEPDERPTAEDALLRLIGHSGVLDTALPDATPADSVPGRASRIRRLLVPGVAGLAIVLVSGGISAAVTLSTADRPSQAQAADPATPGTPRSGPAAWTPRAVPSGPAGPPAPQSKIALPGGLGTAYENPADPVRLTSLRFDKKPTGGSYARTPKSDDFEQAGPYNVVTEVSPDGRWLASMDTLYQATSNHLDVTFTDHLTGDRFSVPTLRAPYQALSLSWSRTSDHVVVTVLEYDANSKPAGVYAAGFVIIDVAARSAVFVPTTDAEEVKAAGSKVNPSEHLPFYRWTPDGRSLVSRYLTAEWGGGMRYRDLSGRAIRLLHWVGNPTGNGDFFSPSGQSFITSGCGPRLGACVWKAVTGERIATIPGAKGSSIIGWYDERHIIEAYAAEGDVRRVVVVDFAGRPVRLLAEIRAPASAPFDVRYSRG